MNKVECGAASPTLVAGDGTSDPMFGYSAALDGGTAVIGAPNIEPLPSAHARRRLHLRPTALVTPSVTGGHGSVSPATAQVVPLGGTQTFTFTPRPGTGWTRSPRRRRRGRHDGNGYYTFAPVYADHALSVSFCNAAGPATTISGPHTWSRRPVTLRFAATRRRTVRRRYTEYKVGSASWKKGDAKTIRRQGQTRVWARSVDTRGNVGPTVVALVGIDDIRPVVTAYGRPTGWTGGETRFRFKVKDAATSTVHAVLVVTRYHVPIRQYDLGDVPTGKALTRRVALGLGVGAWSWRVMVRDPAGSRGICNWRFLDVLRERLSRALRLTAERDQRRGCPWRPRRSSLRRRTAYHHSMDLRTMVRVACVALLAAGLAVGLFACGGSRGSSGASPTASAPASPPAASPSSCSQSAYPGGPKASAIDRDVAYARRLPSPAARHLPAGFRRAAVPVLVGIHGGGFVSGGKDDGQITPVLQGLTRGYAVVALDYRLAPEAPFPAAIADVETAVRWLRAHADEYGLDAARVALWGDSAGGNLAALAGTDGDSAALRGPDPAYADQSGEVQAVVDWFGPISFLYLDEDFRRRATAAATPRAPVRIPAEYLGAPVREVPGKARAAGRITYLPPDDPPILIEHGTADGTVPWPQSRRLAKAWAAATGKDNVTLHLIDGAGHVDQAFYDRDRRRRARLAGRTAEVEAAATARRPRPRGLRRRRLRRRCASRPSGRRACRTSPRLWRRVPPRSPGRPCC